MMFQTLVSSMLETLKKLCKRISGKILTCSCEEGLCSRGKVNFSPHLLSSLQRRFVIIEKHTEVHCLPSLCVYIRGSPRGDWNSSTRQLWGEARWDMALWGDEMVLRRDEQALGGWMRRDDEACLGVMRTTSESSCLSSTLQM